MKAVTKVTDRIEAAQPRRFRPYPEYRDSGVEWLGEIPANWDVKRLKTTASVQLSNVDKHSEEGQVPVKLCNYVDVYYNDLITAELKFMKATATPEQVRRFPLRVGDVLITKDSESWTDIAVPAVVGEDLSDVLCGYHLAHIKPGPDLDGRFLARQFSAIGTRDQFHVAANGITRFGLGGDAIRTGLFPIAPIEEQQAIADFLDRETAKIDGLVARKERLIALLQEKRSALITRAVTRGLDPNVPMKDSGVEWLGEIPAHWEVVRFKRALDYVEGPGIMAADFVAEGVPLIRISGIGGRWATLDSCNYLSPETVRKRWSHFRVRLGDLLISGSASTGFCTEVDEETADAIPYTGIIIIRPRAERASKDFARWMLLSDVFATQVDLARTGSTIQHFGPSHLAEMRVLAPPLHERLAIADHLEIETARIDRLVDRVRNAVDHLREFRTALISAAVTGKIDVREAAAR